MASACHWQQIEAGRPITATILLRICEVFDIPMAKLGRALDAPGVLEAAHAAPIVVSGGDEFAGANIDLQPARTVRIRGRIYVAGLHAKVFLLLRDISAIGDLVLPVYAQERGGDYELYNVTPGQYFIYATSEDMRGLTITRQPLEVTDANLDSVDLSLQPGINLSGSILVEGNSRLGSAPWQVTPSPRNVRLALGHAPSDLSRRGFFRSRRFTLAITIFRLPPTLRAARRIRARLRRLARDGES